MALSATGSINVTRASDGTCGNGAPATSFTITVPSITGETDDNSNQDLFWTYLVDDNGLVVAVNSSNGAAPVGGTISDVAFTLAVQRVPAAGPLHFAIYNPPPSYLPNPVGSTLSRIYIAFVDSFDAHALDSDCPAAPSSNTAPTITSSNTVNVDENTTTVTTVTATDTEDDAVPTPLTYSIAGGVDQALFDIDANTGELTFKTAPDFENPTDANTDNDYVVEVTVTDSGTLSTTQTITITVTDVGEDKTRPSVRIKNAPRSLTDLDPFTVTIKFDEAVTGFQRGDVNVRNGSTSNFKRINAATYTLKITPSGKGNVIIDVPARVARDASGNFNTKADQIVVKNTIAADTQQTIEDLLFSRANHIILSQPDLVQRLMRGSGGHGGSQQPMNYMATGTLDNYVLGFATSARQLDNPALNELMRVTQNPDGTGETYSPFDIWVDGQWSHSSAGALNADAGVLHFGADYLIHPDLLVGLMAGIDSTAQRGTIATTNGVGVLVGPYIATRLHDNLIFDASLQAGGSVNQINPLGTFTDTFTTSRLLAMAKLTGDFNFGDFTFAPILAGSYYGETQQSYVDGLGNVIPEQTIGEASLNFGPQVSYLITGDGVDFTPSLGLIGSWNYAINAKGAATSDLSARFEGGLDLRFDAGASLNFNGFYDGLWSTGPQTYGAGARLDIPLN